VLLTVSYFVAITLVSIAWEGLKLRPLVEQEIGELAPACGVLLVVGALTTFLYEQLGPAGLIPLAALVVLPRLLVPRLSQSRDPAQLDEIAATSLYARAIAEALELGTDQKRVLLDAATHLGDNKRLTRIEDFEGVMQTVLYCREHWDGEGGFPGVLSGAAIPVESRVLAVAEQLAQLTASGTRGLSPERAVATLVPRAGGEFDPHVVAAARWVIEEDILVSPRAERPRGAQQARAVRS
jgi:hypothetical protein